MTSELTSEDGWLRLDPKMLAVAPAQEVVRFVPLLIVAALAGGSENRQWWLLGALGTVVGLGLLRWVTTRYRVTAERMELRSGLVFRQHRSVPRDRVRTVDVTAKPLHRIFGLGVLRIGTGQHERGREGQLVLDAVSSAEAERLRVVLLDRSAAADESLDGTAPPVRRGTELARLSWAWLRFAPLTVLAVGSVGALLGGVWQLLNEAGVGLEDIGAARGVVDWLAERPAGIVVAAAVGSLLVAGAIGSVALYAEAWWGYRLTREPDGTLRVNRGLLAKRSVSLEERRLRGVEITEPLLLRAGRGARLSALGSNSPGGSGGGDRSALLPPAPRAEAHRVASAVLQTADATPPRHPRTVDTPTTAPLRRHPRAALRRRLVRSVLPAAAVVLGLAAAGASGDLPYWPVLTAAAVLLPASVLVGVDRYRNLGHCLTEDYLVIRNGSLVRRTVALRRTGIIGWRVSQSVFQRAAGLATATAVTAAGAGGYGVLDCDLTVAAELVSRNRG